LVPRQDICHSCWKNVSVTSDICHECWKNASFKNDSEWKTHFFSTSGRYPVLGPSHCRNFFSYTTKMPLKLTNWEINNTQYITLFPTVGGIPVKFNDVIDEETSRHERSTRVADVIDQETSHHAKIVVFIGSLPGLSSPVREDKFIFERCLSTYLNSGYTRIFCLIPEVWDSLVTMVIRAKTYEMYTIAAVNFSVIVLLICTFCGSEGWEK